MNCIGNISRYAFERLDYCESIWKEPKTNSHVIFVFISLGKQDSNYIHQISYNYIYDWFFIRRFHTKRISVICMSLKKKDSLRKGIIFRSTPNIINSSWNSQINMDKVYWCWKLDFFIYDVSRYSIIFSFQKCFLLTIT